MAHRINSTPPTSNLPETRRTVLNAFENFSQTITVLFIEINQKLSSLDEKKQILISRHEICKKKIDKIKNSTTISKLMSCDRYPNIYSEIKSLDTKLTNILSESIDKNISKPLEHHSLDLELPQNRIDTSFNDLDEFCEKSFLNIYKNLEPKFYRLKNNIEKGCIESTIFPVDGITYTTESIGSINLKKKQLNDTIGEEMFNSSFDDDFSVDCQPVSDFQFVTNQTTHDAFFDLPSDLSSLLNNSQILLPTVDSSVGIIEDIIPNQPIPFHQPLFEIRDDNLINLASNISPPPPPPPPPIQMEEPQLNETITKTKTTQHKWTSLLDEIIKAQGGKGDVKLKSVANTTPMTKKSSLTATQSAFDIFADLRRSLQKRRAGIIDSHENEPKFKSPIERMMSVAESDIDENDAEDDNF